MSQEQGSSRRSFLGRLLTGAAGGWVALTSTSAVSAFIAACTKKSDQAAKSTDEPLQAKYGGPAVMHPPAGENQPAAPDGGTPAVRPQPQGIGQDGPRLTKYGGAANINVGPVTKYGGQPARPRPRRRRRRQRRPAAMKYGGPRRTKYGGVRRDISDVL